MTNDATPKTSNELAAERTDLPDDRTALALTRTLFALDRTLMAWVRTSVSLISFGFTIYKVFQALPAEAQAHRLLTAREVALVMFGIAVGSLVLATIDYRRQLHALRHQYRQYATPVRSLASTLAIAISALGLIGFVMILLGQ